MKINDILGAKFPEADFRKDIILSDDGDGVIYIKEWNIPDVPKPDQKTLDQWAIEVQAEYELKEIQRKREEAYIKEGITEKALTIALWEAQVENRPEAMQVLEIKRQEVKAKHPKPTV